MLRVENISKRFRKNGRTVLDHLDLSLEKGEFCAVMGGSGSGKSTLLAVVAGFLKPDEGHVFLDGKDLYVLSDKELSSVHRSRIGYVPQSNILLKNYTVLENIVSPYTDGEKEQVLKEKAEVFLSEMGIADLADRFPYELSGGEQKRVCLIRALLMEPEILIADEPTTGLDAVTGDIILRFLDTYAKSGKIILAATHDEHAKALATRVLTL